MGSGATDHFAGITVKHHRSCFIVQSIKSQLILANIAKVFEQLPKYKGKLNMNTLNQSLNPTMNTKGVYSNTDDKTLSQTAAKVQVRNLDFYYGDYKAPQNINLDILDKKLRPSSVHRAVVNQRFLRTLNRMYDLYSGMRATGEIILDNQNILDSRVDVNLLRARWHGVSKPTHFAMSIYDNVAFACEVIWENLSKSELDDRVEWALQKSALWNEVKDKLKNQVYLYQAVSSSVYVSLAVWRRALKCCYLMSRHQH